MKKFLTLTMALLLMVTTVGLTACGGKNKSGADITFDADGNIVASTEGTIITFTSYAEGEKEDVYYQLRDAFNEKYKAYNITANFEKTSSDSYENVTETRLKGKTCHDIVLVSDQYYKKWATAGLLENLDTYIKSENKTLNFEEDIADMNEGAVGRYRYDVVTTKSEGDGAHYYALPKGSGSTVIYYNKDYLKNADVTEISVYEENLAAYNAGEADAYGKTKAQAGIAADATVPAKAYFELGGKWYFNNKIAMSWQECSGLAADLQAANEASGCKYGFITSWWFNYAFSVGGNCIQYLTSSDDQYNGGYYTFTLEDATLNYKAKETVVINGKTYNAGEILDYEDKFYLTDELAAKCDALPSQRRAFAEYMSLAGKKNENHYHEPVGGVSGVTDAFYQIIPYKLAGTATDAIAKNTEYMKDGNGTDYASLPADQRYGDMVVVYNKGISTSPGSFGTDGLFGSFQNGASAMVVDVRASTAIARSIKKFDWDVAPMLVYKEFDGNDNVTVAGNEGAHSGSTAWAMWKKSTVKNAAYLFIKFAAGEEGQRILAQSGSILPNQKTLASEILAADLADGKKPMNAEIFARGAEYQTPGDWWFLSDGEWIDGNGCWSIPLNKQVREYKMTMNAFMASKEYKNTFELLQKYTKVSNR